MSLPHGKLWYDDSKSNLEEKIARALRFYARRDQKFNTVYVHPSVTPVTGTMCGIRVIPNSYTLLHHFLFCNLGNGEQAAGAQSAVTRTGG